MDSGFDSASGGDSGGCGGGAADVADAEDKNRFMDYTSDPIWLRIDGLIFDDNSHPLTFSKRLARENRWAHWFALDVMEEYKISLSNGRIRSSCNTVY